MNKLLRALMLSIYLINPSISCNFKNLEEDATSIVNRLYAHIKVEKEDVLECIRNLQVNIVEQEDQYTKFQNLYSDFLTKTPAFSSFAYLCKNIHDDSDYNDEKTKISVYLLLEEVFKKLETLEKIQKKNEILNSELEENPKKIDIDQEVEYFLNAHKPFKGLQLKFPPAWGAEFFHGSFSPIK